jgi:hypothetical protein
MDIDTLIRSAEWTLKCNVEEVRQAKQMREHHQHYVTLADQMESRATEGIATCKDRIKQLKDMKKEQDRT